MQLMKVYNLNKSLYKVNNNLTIYSLCTVDKSDNLNKKMCTQLTKL